MKHLKKIGTLLLVIAMVFAMAIPAFATDITINGTAVDYKAWKILDAKDVGNGKYEYTVNDTYRSVLQAVTGKTEDADILEYIEAITTNSAEARTFADAVYEKVKNMTAIVSTGKTFSNVEQGYYLIAEKDPVTVDENNKDVDDTYSLVMLYTAGEENIIVDSKESKPTLEKEIKHNETGAWGDVGDNQIGDTVEFRIITTIPSDIAHYTTYTYMIHDIMSGGLTPDVVNGNSNGNLYIKINDTDTLLPTKYYTVSVAAATPQEFALEIDLKTAIADGVITASDTLYTYFTAKVNEFAVIYTEGKQNNRAHLKYSNNPYDESSYDTTPDDIVYDWTFKMNIKKVDAQDTTKMLTGALFVLSKNANLTIPTLDEDGNLSSTTDLIPLLNGSGDDYLIAPEGATDVEYVITAGLQTLKGLDDETDYYLYEIQAPEGYTLLTRPVHFKITAGEYSDAGATIDVTGTKLTVNSSEIEGMTAAIGNNSGSKLPETGGIGTTIFYIAGGLMAFGAVVLLITKRRMGDAE